MQGHACVAAGENKSDPEGKRKKKTTDAAGQIGAIFCCHIFLMPLMIFWSVISVTRKTTNHNLPWTHSDSNLEKMHFIFEGIQSFERSNGEK